MKNNLLDHNLDVARIEERDTSIQKWQTPRLKPILGALALVVAELFFVTQVAWALDLNHINAFKRQFRQRTLEMQRMMLPQQMDRKRQEQQAALDRKNLVIENFGNTDSSFLALADVESQPLTEDSVPRPVYRLGEEEKDDRKVIQLARGPLVGVEVLGRTTDEAGFGHVTLRTEDGALKDATIGSSLFTKVPAKEKKPVAPGTYLAEGLAGGAGLLEARETLGGELITSLSPILHMREETPEKASLRETIQRQTQVAESETVLPETSSTLPVDIDTFKDEYGQIPVIDARTGKAKTSFEKYIDSLSELFHAAGRAALKAFLEEAEELENIERTDPEAARIAKAHLTGKRERDGQEPPNPGQQDTPRDRFQFSSSGNAQFDAFLQNLTEEMERRLAEGPETTKDSYTYVAKEVGVKFDADGNVVSTYTRYVKKTFTLHRGELRLIGRTTTTNYENADGTTGTKVEMAKFGYDDRGRLVTRDIEILLNGFVYDEDLERVTGPFNNFRMTLHQQAIRDEEGQIVKFISVSTVGDIENRYVLEIEERDTAYQKTRWKETTTVTNLRTGEVRTTETEGHATGFDDQGRATGFEINEHVFGGQDDYFRTITIEGIVYGRDNEWVSFRRTIETDGFVGLPDGGGEMVHRREVYDHWVDSETGDAMITTRVYENGVLIDTTTYRQSEMPEYMALYLDGRFVALAPLLGINFETFVNGTLDAQNFLTAMGISMPLETLLGLTGDSELAAAFAQMDPDAVDALVAGALMALLFEVVKTYAENVGQDIADEEAENRRTKVINNFVDRMPDHLKAAARQIAENLFDNLADVLADIQQDPAKMDALIGRLRDAGLTGNLSKVELRSMGYTETVMSSTSDIIERRTVIFEYDEEGRISQSLERVHRFGRDNDGKVIDQTYSIERSDYRYSENGVLIGYRETLIGVNENGEVTPGLKVERDVTPEYGPDGRLIRMTSVNTYSITDERRAEVQAGIDAIDRRVAEIKAKLKGKVGYKELIKLRNELKVLEERKKRLAAERDAEPFTRKTVQDRFEYDEQGNVIGYRQITRDAEGNVVDHNEVSGIYIHPVTQNVVRQIRTTYVRDGVTLEKPEVRTEYNKQYDMRGRLIRQTIEQDGKTFVEAFKYNRLDQLIWSRNQQGITSNYTYNRSGQVTGYEMHFFEGETKYVKVYNIRYDGFGRKVGETRRAYIENKDVKGWQTTTVTYGYDQLGRIAWEETHSVFKGNTKKGDHKVTIKEGWRTTYTYGPNGQEKRERRLYYDQEIKRGFWANVVHNLFGGFVFDAIAEIFEAFGWEKGANFVRQITPILQMVGIMIAAILAAPFSGGQSLTFGMMLGNALFVAAVTGAAAFMMNVANGMSVKDALIAFAKGLALAVVTAGLMQGLEAFASVIDSIARLGWDILTTIPKLIGIALKFVKDVGTKIYDALNTAYTKTLRKFIEKFGGTAGATGGMITLSTAGKIMQDVVRQLVTAAFMQIKLLRDSDTAKLLTLFALGAYFGNVVNSFILPIGQEMIQGNNPEDMGYAVYALYAFNVGLQASGGDFLNLFRNAAGELSAVVSKGAFIAQSLYQALQDQLLAELGEALKPDVILKTDDYGNVLEKKKGDLSLGDNILISIARSLTGYEMFTAIRHFTFGKGPLIEKQATPGGKYQTLQFNTFGDFLKGRASHIAFWSGLPDPADPKKLIFGSQQMAISRLGGQTQIQYFNSLFEGGAKPFRTDLLNPGGKSTISLHTYKPDGTQVTYRTDFFQNNKPVATELYSEDHTVRINHLDNTVTVVGRGVIPIPIYPIFPFVQFTFPQAIANTQLDGPFLRIQGKNGDIATYDLNKVMEGWGENIVPLTTATFDKKGQPTFTYHPEGLSERTFSSEAFRNQLPEALRDVEITRDRLDIRFGTQVYVYADNEKSKLLFIHDLASGWTLVEGREKNDVDLYVSAAGGPKSVRQSLPELFKHIELNLKNIQMQQTAAGPLLTIFDAVKGQGILSLDLEGGELAVSFIHPQGLEIALGNQTGQVLHEWNAAHPENQIDPNRLDANAAKNLFSFFSEKLSQLQNPDMDMAEREVRVNQIRPLVQLLIARMGELEGLLGSDEIQTLKNSITTFYQIAIQVVEYKISAVQKTISILKENATGPGAADYQNHLQKLETQLVQATNALTHLEDSIDQNHFDAADVFLSNAMNLPSLLTLRSEAAGLLYKQGGIQEGRVNALKTLLKLYEAELKEARSTAAPDTTRIEDLTKAISYLNSAINTGLISPELQNILLTPQRRVRLLLSQALPELLRTQAAGGDITKLKADLLAKAEEISPAFRERLENVIRISAGITSPEMEKLSSEARAERVVNITRTELIPAVLELNRFLETQGYLLYAVPSADGRRVESRVLDINEIRRYKITLNGKTHEFRVFFVTYPGADSGVPGGALHDLETRLSHYGYSMGDYNVVLQDNLGRFVEVINDSTFRDVEGQRLEGLVAGQALTVAGYQVIANLTADHEVGHAVERLLGHIDPTDAPAQETAAYFRELAGAETFQEAWGSLKDLWGMAKHGPEGAPHTIAARNVLRALYTRLAQKEGGDFNDLSTHPKFQRVLMRLAEANLDGFRSLIGEGYEAHFGRALVQPELEEGSTIPNRPVSLEAVGLALNTADDTFITRAESAYNRLGAFTDDIITAINNNDLDAAKGLLQSSGAFVTDITAFFNEVSSVMDALSHVPSSIFGEQMSPEETANLSRTLRQLGDIVAEEELTLSQAQRSPTLRMTDSDSIPVAAVVNAVNAAEVIHEDDTITKPGSVKTADGTSVNYNEHRHLQIQNNDTQTLTTIDRYFQGEKLVYLQVSVKDLVTGRITNFAYTGTMELNKSGGLNLIDAKVFRTYTTLATLNGVRQEVLIEEISIIKDNELISSNQVLKSLEGIPLGTLDPQELQNQLNGVDASGAALRFTALDDPKNLGEIEGLRGREKLLTLYEVTRTVETEEGPKTETFHVLANDDFSEQFRVEITRQGDAIQITKVIYDSVVDPLTGNITVPFEVLENGKFVSDRFEYARLSDPKNLASAELKLKAEGFLEVSGLHLYKLTRIHGTQQVGEASYVLATQDLSEQYGIRLGKNGQIKSIQVQFKTEGNNKKVTSLDFENGEFVVTERFFGRKSAANLSSAQKIPLLAGFHLYEVTETVKLANGSIRRGETSMVMANDDLSDIYGVTMEGRQIEAIHISFERHAEGATSRSFIFDKGRFEDTISKYTLSDLAVEKLPEAIAALKAAEGLKIEGKLSLYLLEQTVDGKKEAPAFVLVNDQFTQQFGVSLNEERTRVIGGQISFDRKTLTGRALVLNEKTGQFDDVISHYAKLDLVLGNLPEAERRLGVGALTVYKLNRIVNGVEEDPSYVLINSDFNRQYSVELNETQTEITRIPLGSKKDPKTGNIIVTSLDFTNGEFHDVETHHLNTLFNRRDLEVYRSRMREAGYSPEDFTLYEVVKYIDGKRQPQSPTQHSAALLPAHVPTIPLANLFEADGRQFILLSNDFNKQYGVNFRSGKIESLNFRTEGENGAFTITTWTPNKKGGIDEHLDLYAPVFFDESSLGVFRDRNVIGSDQHTLYKVIQKLNGAVQADFHLLVNEDFSKQFVATLEGDRITSLMLRTEDTDTFKLTTFTLSGNEIIETSAIFNKKTGELIRVESPYAERLQTLESLVAQRDYLNALILYLTASSDARDTPGQDGRDAQVVLHRQELARIEIQIAEAQDLVAADLLESLKAQGYDTTRLTRENVVFVNNDRSPKLTVDITSEKEVGGRNQVIKIEPNAIFGIDAQTGGYAVHTGVLRVGNLKLAYRDFNPEIPAPQDDQKPQAGEMVSTGITQVELDVDENNNYWVTGRIEVKDFARLLVVPGSRIALLGNQQAIILGDTFDPATSEIGRVIVIEFDSRLGEDGKTPIGAVARDITGEVLAAQETFRQKRTMPQRYSAGFDGMVDDERAAAPRFDSDVAPNFDIVPSDAGTGRELNTARELVNANIGGDTVRAMPVLDASIGRIFVQAMKVVWGNVVIRLGKEFHNRGWIESGEALAREGQMNQAVLGGPWKQALAKPGILPAITSFLSGFAFFALAMPQFIAEFVGKPWELIKKTLDPNSPDFILTSMARTFAQDLKTNVWFGLGELAVFGASFAVGGFLKGAGLFRVMKQAAKAHNRPALAARALGESITAGVSYGIRSALMLPVHLVTFPITMTLGIIGKGLQFAGVMRLGKLFNALGGNALRSYLANFSLNHPIAFVRANGFFGNVSAFMNQFRFADASPERLLESQAEAYLLQKTAAEMLKGGNNWIQKKSLQLALQHFTKQLGRIDTAILQLAGQRGELDRLIDLGSGRGNELFGQRISNLEPLANLMQRAANFYFGELLRTAGHAESVSVFGELLQRGMMPETIREAVLDALNGGGAGPRRIAGIEIVNTSVLRGILNLAQKFNNTLRLPERVQQLAFDQFVYEMVRTMPGYSPQDIRTIIDGEGKPIDLLLPGGDANYSRVYRTVRLSNGQEVEVTPVRLAAARRIYEVQGERAANLLFEGLFRGLRNPAEILNRLNALGKIIFDPANYGKTLREILPAELMPRLLRGSPLADYRLTPQSHLFKLLHTKLESYNSRFGNKPSLFNLGNPYRDFWKPVTSTSSGKSAPGEYGGTPEQVRTQFESQMNAAENHRAKAKEWAKANGVPESQAEAKWLRSELKRVKLTGREIRHAVRQYRQNPAGLQEFLNGLRRTELLTPDGRVNPEGLRNHALAEVVDLLVNVYPDFKLDRRGSGDQLTFLYLITERDFLRLNGESVPTALLQLVQGGGKTLGVLIGKEAAYSLHLKQKPNASFHDLIVTSRDQLAFQYFKEGSLERRVIDHMRDTLGVEIRNVSSKEVQNVENIGPVGPRSLLVMDNYNFKRLSMSLTKLYQEKEALQPKLLAKEKEIEIAGQDLRATEAQYRANTGRNIPSLLDAASELGTARRTVVGRQADWYQIATRLKEVEAKIEDHYLAKVKKEGGTLFDEIQEALADSDLIEGPGGALLETQDPTKIEGIRADIRGRIKTFQALQEEFLRTDNPYDAIENVLHGQRRVRGQYQFRAEVVQRVSERLKHDPDVASLGERGRGSEFEQFADATANALMYREGTDYFIRARGEALRYSTGRFGVNQLETVFGNRELGTAVLIKEYLNPERNFVRAGESVNAMARRFTTNESILNSIADSYLHHEFNRTTTLNALALVGLEKTTFVTGTSKGIRHTLKKIGALVYAIQKESPIKYQENLEHVLEVPVANEGDSIKEAVKQVRKALAANAKGVKIVITGADGALLAQIREALIKAGLGEQLHITRIRGQKGSAHITTALDAVRKRFESHPDQNHLILVPDFGAGSNLFAFIENVLTGEKMPGSLKPTIIEMGLRGETHRQQLGARMNGVIRADVQGRETGRFITIINEQGRELTDTERVTLGRITDPAKREAFWRDTSRRMDREIDTQNVVRVVQVSLTHAERRLVEHRIYDRVVKGALERSKRRAEVSFEEAVKNITQFREALEKLGIPVLLIPDVVNAIQGFRLGNHRLLDEDGNFTKEGTAFLRLMDDLIQFDASHELKEDALALIASAKVSVVDKLRQLNGAAATLREAPEKYAADVAFIALGWMEYANSSDPFMMDPLSFAGARNAFRETFNEALLAVLEVLPDAMAEDLTDEEFNVLFEELVTKIKEVQKSHKDVPAFMLTEKFTELVLARIDRALAGNTLSPIERERAEHLKGAITELSGSLMKTVDGKEEPKSFEEFMFTMMQIAAKPEYPEVSALDLLSAMQPLMSHSKREQAGHAMDALGQVVKVGRLEELGLKEAVLAKIRESTRGEKIDTVAVLQRGLTTNVLAGRNFLLVSHRPTLTGNGMVYQFGTSPLQYREEDDRLILTGDSRGTRTPTGELVKEPPVKKVAVREIEDEKVRAALAARGLGEDGAVRVVNYEKGLLTETYYLAPEADRILHAAVDIPLYTEDLARSLGFLFPGAGALKKGDRLLVHNYYKEGENLVQSAVFARDSLGGERKIGQVRVEQMPLREFRFSTVPGRESLYRRLLRHGVHSDQTVAIRTFQDHLGNDLSDVGGEKILHVSAIQAGNAALPTTARHLFGRAVTSQVSTEERKPGLLVMELDFMQKDSIDMRNDSPTGEVENFESQVSINYHPGLMDAFENRFGFDPESSHTVAGVDKKLYLFLSLFYRMNIHEFRGHLRFESPVLKEAVAKELGLTSRILTEDLLKEILAKKDQLGITVVPSEARPGILEIRLRNGDVLVGLDDSNNIATLGTELTDANGRFSGFKHFDSHGSYKIQTSERIAETLSGAHYRATDHAARFMWFFGLKQEQHSADRIDQNIEEMVHRYGAREADDYLSLIHDPVLKEDVKHVTKRFSEGHFKSLDEQRTHRLARYYGVEPERSLTPPEPPKTRLESGHSILDIPAMVPMIMSIGQGLMVVDRGTYDRIKGDYEIEKLADPNSPFVRVMSLFFETDTIDLGNLQSAVEARLSRLGELSIADRRALSERLTSLYQVIEGARLLASAFRSGPTAERDALVYEVGQALEALIRQVAHIEVGEGMLFETRSLLSALRTFALIFRDDKAFGQAFNRMAFFFDKQGGRLLNDRELSALIRSRGKNIFDGGAFPIEKFVTFYNEMLSRGIKPNEAEQAVLSILTLKDLIDRDLKTGRYFVKHPENPGSIAAFDRSKSSDESSFILAVHEIIHTFQHTHKPLMDALRNYHRSLANRTVTVQGKAMNGLEVVKMVLSANGEYKTSDPELIVREFHAHFREPRQFLGKLQGKLDQNARRFIEEIRLELRQLEAPFLAEVLGVAGEEAAAAVRDAGVKITNFESMQHTGGQELKTLPLLPGAPPKPSIPMSFNLPKINIGLEVIPVDEDNDDQFVFDGNVVQLASVRSAKRAFAQEGPVATEQPTRTRWVEEAEAKTAQAKPVQLSEMRPKQEAVPPEMREWFVVGEIARKSGGIPAEGRKTIQKILRANPEARDLLYDHIDRIELPKHFQEGIQQGELRPAELLKLLILVSRIHKAGVLDGVKINGVNITDVQKFFEGYGIGEIPITAMDLLLFLNAAKGALNAELFVEKVKVELLRNV